MYNTASKLVCPVIKRISEKKKKKSNLLEKDTERLQVYFLCEKRAVPNFDNSLVSSDFKLFKAGNAFSPRSAQGDILILMETSKCSPSFNYE